MGSTREMNSPRAARLEDDISRTYDKYLADIKRRHFARRPEDKHWDVAESKYWYMFDPEMWYRVCNQPRYQKTMHAVQKELIRKLGPTLRQRMREALSDKPHPQIATYVDLGTGNGIPANFHLKEIADFVGEYIGVDIIGRFLEDAKDNVIGNFPKKWLRAHLEFECQLKSSSDLHHLIRELRRSFPNLIKNTLGRLEIINCTCIIDCARIL